MENWYCHETLDRFRLAIITRSSVDTLLNVIPRTNPMELCAPQAQTLTTSATQRHQRCATMMKYYVMNYYDCVSQYAVDLLLEPFTECAQSVRIRTDTTLDQDCALKATVQVCTACMDVSLWTTCMNFKRGKKKEKDKKEKERGRKDKKDKRTNGLKRTKDKGTNRKNQKKKKKKTRKKKKRRKKKKKTWRKNCE